MPRLARRNLAIRTRIALTIVAVSTSALVLMALAVFIGFRAILIENLDENLRLRATASLPLIVISPDGPRPRPPALDVELTDDAEAFLRLYGSDGALLAARGARLPAPVAERSLVNQALRGSEAIATVGRGRERFRVLAMPVTDPGATGGVLVTGLSWEEVGEPLALLRVILLIAVPLTSVVLGAGAFVIARRALRPVHDITATARGIAAGDLRRRITGIATVDEVGELAETFNTMIGRLAETIERERRFTGDASHELRTPLAAMATALEVTLSRDRDPAEYRQTLQLVRGQTARLTRMVRQLLMLSRLDAEAPLGFVPVVVDELVEAVLSGFTAQHPGMTLALASAAEGLSLHAEPELLARAFTNVLDNTAAHAGAKASVQVKLRRFGPNVVIAFSDNGPGFPGDLLTTAFQRFRRGDASRAGGGAGLGLAIVESITQLHGGTVAIANAGGGAIVAFTFPLPPTDTATGR